MRHALVLAILLACAAPSWGQAATPTAEELVQVDLVADVLPVAGGELWLGARFKIAPDWHLYWQNPGDSGIPPELSLTLPEGLEAVGDWRWPAPERATLPSLPLLTRSVRENPPNCNAR